MKKVMTGLLLISSLFGDADAEKVFTAIYNDCIWGLNEDGQCGSGAGSNTLNTREYVTFLEQFMKYHEIKTVVDVGCGDWTFSRKIKWGNIHYLGLDVVQRVIDENIQKYSSPNIHFQWLDVLQEEVPVADLLICKDVLCHLSNNDVIAFIKLTKQFKHCLLTCDIGCLDENTDINRGSYRTLDLTKPPFNVNGMKIFTIFPKDGAGGAMPKKQVLYIRN